MIVILNGGSAWRNRSEESLANARCFAHSGEIPRYARNDPADGAAGKSWLYYTDLLDDTIKAIRGGNHICEKPFCPLPLAAPIIKIIKDKPEVVKALASLLLFISEVFDFLQGKNIRVFVERNPGQTFNLSDFAAAIEKIKQEKERQGGQKESNFITDTCLALADYVLNDNAASETLSFLVAWAQFLEEEFEDYLAITVVLAATLQGSFPPEENVEGPDIPWSPSLN